MAKLTGVSKLVRKGDVDTHITFRDIAVPLVEKVLEATPSDKGNRTVIFASDEHKVWVEDGNYSVVVNVTAYVKSGSLDGSDTAKEAALNDSNKSIAAKVSKTLAGLTPEQIAQALALAGKLQG